MKTKNNRCAYVRHQDNQKKVLFIITGLETGGAEMLLLRHACYLKSVRSYEVTIVSLSGEGELSPLFRKAGLSIVSVKSKGKYNPLLLFRLSLLVTRLKPDILHSHLFHANVVARLVGWLTWSPVIVSTIHNENFGGPFREWIMRLSDWMASCTVVISPSVEKVMLEKRIVKRKKIRLVTNGVDTTVFLPADAEKKKQLRRFNNLPFDKKVFLAVGRLREQKGYEHLIDAVQKLAKNRSDFLVVVLGDGELKNKLRGKTKVFGLVPYIDFRGNQADVLSYFQSADIFIMPSLWEGLPVALMEAMSCKLPVIASAVGAIPTVVDSGISGLLVPPQASDQLAKSMEYMLEAKPIDMINMGEHGRNSIQEYFSQTKMFLAYDALYDTFLSLDKN